MPVVPATVVAARRALVLQLMQAGCSRPQVIAALTEHQDPQIRCGARLVDQLYDEVLRGWGEAFERDRSSFKLQQAERLRGFIAAAAAERRWAQVAQLERLYAEVVGTMAPIRVEVEDGRVVRDALAALLASLTEQELDVIAARQAELEAQAAQVHLLEERHGNGRSRRRPGSNGT